jgi:heme/copper-type cytochrome/quinol oxidase subunit 3
VTDLQTVDVSALPPYSISNRSTLFWGQGLLCAIEGSMLCILIAVYFYLRLGVDVWPTPGAHVPGVTISTLALIPLLASCVGSYMASEAAKKNNRRGMIFGLTLNLVLGIVFFLLRLLEWKALNFTWASDAHGSIVWTILFLHSFDLIADLIMTAVLIVILVFGRGGEKQRVGVHVDSIIWYFLVGIWIPLYGTVYWAPHFLGGGR